MFIENVGEGITHSDLYAIILDLLRYMFQAGFGEGVIDIGMRYDFDRGDYWNFGNQMSFPVLHSWYVFVLLIHSTSSSLLTFVP